MTNKKDNASDEHLYQHTEGLLADHSESEEAYVSRFGRFAAFLKKNKRAVFVLILILVALIAFTVMRKRDQQMFQKKRFHAVVAPAAPRQIKKSVPIAVLKSRVNPKDQLATFQRNRQSFVSKIQSDVGHLDRRLDGMDRQLREVQRRQLNLSHVILGLTQKIQQLSARLEKNIRLMKQLLDHSSDASSHRVPVLHIKAIVPGRAWITDRNGLGFSVSSGDVVPGYGVVTKVDAQRGLLLMDSGRNIVYGMNDH